MLARLRRYFISGLVALLPVALSVYLLISVFSFADGLLGKYIQPYFDKKFGFYIKGVGILISVSFVALIGFLATNFFGRKIYAFFEKLLLKLPFFRQVYPAIKEIALFLFSREKLAFKQVVIVEYPRKGIFAFGFLTNETSAVLCEKIRQDTVNVFIPSAPGPLTGYVALIPRKDVIFSDVSIEDAIKFNVSGGVVNPLHA